ncbi:uncharacterized protein G2W53_028002 [Senna tora]|uniref:Uncharacterized protein n=1 Tax=Senna tora TaxID=362788 RepID=A0A834T2L4_9FABA|nr:uncharacterized protein G2W53_028002 [Senna tora]
MEAAYLEHQTIERSIAGESGDGGKNAGFEIFGSFSYGFNLLSAK